MSKTPAWKHDCDKCRFLGRTIGGGRMTDLYVCEPMTPKSFPTLIARYGDEGNQYYSTPTNHAHAHGHSELFAALIMWQETPRPKS